MIAHTTSLYSAISKSISKSAYKIEILHLIGFLIIVGIQTAHFFFYSEFAITHALLWALLDWSIWFILFLPLFYNNIITSYLKTLALSKIYLFTVITITFPLLHALIGLFTYSVFVGIEGSFYDNLSLLVSRRWFHNMLISAVLVLAFDNVKRILQPDPEIQNDSKKDENKIVLKDGFNLYQLSPQEIQWVSAARNYVIIETAEKQLLIRMTLNAACDKMNQFGFIKISRSRIVNKKLIHEVKRKSQYSQIAIMKTGHEFPIGRTYLKSVVNLMIN